MDNEQQVNHYPLNFGALKKGDRFSVEQLAEIVHCHQGSAKFQLKVLALRGRIDDELKARGTLWTVKSDHGALVICEDSDAAITNRKRGRKAIRQFARSHARNLAVDQTKLTDDERKQHERTLLVNGSVLCAIKKERTKLKLSTAERKTPGLIVSESEGD